MKTETFIRVNPTVDIAALRRRNNIEILLGKKKQNLPFVIPGGFSDADSLSYEIDASRELKEETHLIADPSKLVYVGSTIIRDPRPIVIKTAFFVAFNFSGEAKAGDDLEYVEWVELPNAKPLMASYHHVLIDMLEEWVFKFSLLTPELNPDTI